MVPLKPHLQRFTFRAGLHDGDITITNTGTINSTQHGTINNYAYGVSGDITIINSGTIKGEGGVHPATNHNPKWLGVIELEGCTSSSTMVVVLTLQEVTP